MPQIVEFKTKDGAVVLIEGKSKSGNKQISRGKYGQKALKSLEESLSAIKPLLDEISSNIKAIKAPSDIVIKFSFKLTADAGLVIASAGTEAQFAVEMKWSDENK